MNIEIRDVKLLNVDGKEILLNHSTESIINLVCRVFEISKDELMYPLGNKHAKDAKKLCQWLILKFEEKTFVDIAKIFGMNHSSVFSNVKRVDELLEIKDEFITSKLEKIIDLL